MLFIFSQYCAPEILISIPIIWNLVLWWFLRLCVPGKCANDTDAIRLQTTLGVASLSMSLNSTYSKS